MRFGSVKPVNTEKRTTKACKKCGKEFPFEDYRWISKEPGKQKRSPRCPKCEEGSTRLFGLDKELKTMLEALGNDQLSVNQWAEKMELNTDYIRHRANILVRRKLIKRTTGVIPFLFFKA